MVVELPPPPPPSVPVPAGWEGLLAPGEVILWQGRPDGRIAVTAGELPQIAVGLFMCGFALFWMYGASRGGGFFWMFGLILLFAGFGRIAKDTLGAARRRRASYYTLTNRRAIIATDLPFVGRGMQSYPINANTRLELIEAGDLGRVNFAMGEAGKKSSPQAIGFERISDAREVISLMRHIQGEAT